MNNKNNPQVYIISMMDFKRESAGVTRMKNYAKALSLQKIETFLITCRNRKISNHNFSQISGSVYAYNDTKTSKDLFGLGKISFLKSILPKKNNLDRVYLFYPSTKVIFELFVFIYLKLIKKQKVFYELNEIRRFDVKFEWSNNAISVHRKILSSFFLSYYLIIEHTWKFYDGIICISSNIEKYAKCYNANTLRIPILTSLQKKQNISFPNIYKVKNYFNIGFSGSIDSSKENLVTFIIALSRLINQNLNLSFNLCGNMDSVNKMIIFDNLVKKLNLENSIKYFGYLNNKELNLFIQSQDLLVLPRCETRQNKFGFSTKLSDYLSNLKPVLVTDISDNAQFIVDGKTGFISEDCTEEIIYQKLRQILTILPKNETKIIKNISILLKNKLNFPNFSIPLKMFLYKINF